MARILEFITRLVWRWSPNKDLDLEIFDQELDQERAKALEQIAHQQLWELDWQRERNGWIGAKDEDF